MPEITFALDRSARTVDVDGRLHVAVSNISAARVNPYFGSEIPGADTLGLSANKVYHLLRHPDELAKAAPTFNNLQLLSKHVPVSVERPSKEITVGSLGTDAVFEAPFLKNSLVVWDQNAIDLITSSKQRELSCGYRYTPVMTPGVYEGVPYDGIMTNIIGNHVALVKTGRAGPDVVVGDSSPFSIFLEQGMKKKNPGLAAAILGAVGVLVRPQIAQDSTPLDLRGVIGAPTKATFGQDKVRIAGALLALVPALDKPALDAALQFAHDAADPDEEDEASGKKPDKKAEDEESEEEKAEREKKEKAKADEDKKGMDAASVRAEIAQAVAAARADAIKQATDGVNAMHAALRAVVPLVGEVAGMDSAAAVYKFALDSSGVKTDGVHESAFPALVAQQIALAEAKKQPAKSAHIAQDSAAGAAITKRFPNYKAPGKM